MSIPRSSSTKASMDSDAPSVAVIGLGALGLVALKNLVEEGFNVTGFERNNWVGGLWHFTDQDITSVLPSTIVNISKERGCFTDFPFPDDAASHCTSADVQRYLENYVQHFNLTPRLKLNTCIQLVVRDDKNGRWEVRFEDGQSRYFDKVVMATGTCQEPYIPELVDGEKFKGTMIHSRAFKSGANFDGQRVLVVGMSNTGADTVEQLRGHAKEIYLSHRHGIYVLPRRVNGVPFDHTMSLRKNSIKAWFEEKVPAAGEFIMNKMIANLQNTVFRDIRPEWGVSPAQSIKHGTPVISDDLINNLRSGAVKSVVGISKAVGEYQLELTDGSVVEVDAIIWCTGYQSHFKLLDPAVDPTRHTTPLWLTLPGSKGKPLPRLYQNVISLDYPQSLAVMGSVAMAAAAFSTYDLASMALSQIWKGNSPLPSSEEMAHWVDEQHAFICDIAKDGSVIPSWVRERKWMAWANGAAGTGLDEYLGWGLQSWKFWWEERGTYDVLMNGVYTPFIYRLFDCGKRKAWPGALDEITKVNAYVSKQKKQV